MLIIVEGIDLSVFKEECKVEFVDNLMVMSEGKGRVGDDFLCILILVSNLDFFLLRYRV